MEPLLFTSVNFPLLNLLLVLAINIIGVLLGVTIVTRNSFRDKITSVFVVMTMLMLMWIDFAYLARLVGNQNYDLGELFLRLAWMATPPFFAYVYLMTVHILQSEHKARFISACLIILSLILSLITAFTNYIIAGTTFSGNVLDIIYGPGFYPFLVVISLYIVATFIPMFKAKIDRSRRRRVHVYLAGVIIFYIANLVFNIALPAFFGITHLYYLGDYSLLFLVGLTAYAIIRYRLLDIKAMVFRAVGFTALASSFFILDWLIIWWMLRQFSQFTLSATTYGAIAAVNALLAVPAYRQWRYLLRLLTDRFLFQNKVDYQRALVRLNKELTSTIQINEVMSSVLRAMENVVRAEKSIILLRDSKNTIFEPCGNLNAADFHAAIDIHNPLVKHFTYDQNIIVDDRLRAENQNMQSAKKRNETEHVERALTWLDVTAVVPLFVHNQLTGLFLLGGKLSGEPFRQEDIDFLNSFAPSAAIALENARLYQESQEFGNRLKEEVESATKNLQLANHQLRQLDEAKSEFLSIASHQLYTPLTAIRGYLSMIQEGDYGPMVAKQQPIIDILTQSAERLIELIKNLLDISRIESGRFELSLEEVNVAQMAKEIVQDLMPNAMTKNLHLLFHESPQPVANVIADRERLRQVMLNFVDNAIKYTNRGHVDATVRQEHNNLIFSVTDTGKGLNQEEISRLFTKFTRVGGASRYHTEGTGLGLYIARKIIHEHHGEVQAASPGKEKGSTFTMIMPVMNSPSSLKIGDKATVTINLDPLPDDKK